MAKAAIGRFVICWRLGVTIFARHTVMTKQRKPAVIVGKVVPILLVMTGPAVAEPTVALMRRTGDLVAVGTVMNVRQCERAQIVVAFSAIKSAVCAGHDHDLAAVAKGRRDPGLFGMALAAVKAQLRLVWILVTRRAFPYCAAELAVCVACSARRLSVGAAQGKSCFVMVKLDRRFEVLPGILGMARVARNGLWPVRDFDKRRICRLRTRHGVASVDGLGQKRAN